MDLDKSRRVKDGKKLGDWNGEKRCKAHGNLIDGEYRCLACEQKVKSDENRKDIEKRAKGKDKKKDKDPEGGDGE